jgi:hypothetical protein
MFVPRSCGVRRMFLIQANCKSALLFGLLALPLLLATACSSGLTAEIAPTVTSESVSSIARVPSGSTQDSDGSSESASLDDNQQISNTVGAHASSDMDNSSGSTQDSAGSSASASLDGSQKTTNTVGAHASSDLGNSSDSVKLPDNSQHAVSKNLPDINYFAVNKSDRFIVDFEDIVAAHPYVGERSPRPHNDAQIYFSNTDTRWRDASKPSEYPPIYAVADGYINMPTNGFYNVVDHSNDSLPWWHVAYVFTLKIAQQNGEVIDFLYQMEPYMIPELTGKSKDFYKQFLLVENGQYVQKGDVLGYMYVPSFDEMIGAKTGSSHIAFSLIKQPETVLVPAIFNEEIIEKFASIYRNPTEGWSSKSFGSDWNRGRGLPDAMGWMVSGKENPFNNNHLGVLIHDGVIDKNLNAKAMVYPQELGFLAENILYSEHGWGDSPKDSNGIKNITIEEDWELLFSGMGGPMTFTVVIDENGSIRESQVFELRPGQNFSLNHTSNFLGNSFPFSISISDPNEWGWSFAFAKKGSGFIKPGTSRDVSPLCPPGCPPSPNPYKLNQKNP